MCIPPSFLSLLSSGQPGWTEFYSLHFGNTCSLAAIFITACETTIAMTIKSNINAVAEFLRIANPLHRNEPELMDGR
jgi:hypothetical protein